MAKQFSFTTPDAVVHEFRVYQYTEAAYAAMPYIDTYGYDGAMDKGCEFKLCGESVTARDYMLATEIGHDKWLATKQLTHKRVKMLHGSSVACYVWVWVKK